MALDFPNKIKFPSEFGFPREACFFQKEKSFFPFGAVFLYFFAYLIILFYVMYVDI